MRIIIDFRNSWQGSFLKEGLNIDNFKTGIDFIGTSKSKVDFPRKTPLSLNSIEGILYRLVGDQRRLFQIKDRYLSFLDGKIKFNMEVLSKTQEVLGLRNIQNADSPSGYEGIAAPEEHPYYTKKKYSKLLLWPLVATPLELKSFILKGDYGEQKQLQCKSRGDAEEYLSAVGRDSDCFGRKVKLEEIFSKAELDAVQKALVRKFPDVKYDPKDRLNYSAWVFGSLYLMSDVLREDKLTKSDASFIDNLPNKRKWNQGISKRGITLKDFREGLLLKKGTTIINPTIKGRNNDLVSKFDGTITIDLDIDDEEAIKLKEMIDRASVASFFVGKKGLAYMRKVQL